MAGSAHTHSVKLDAMRLVLVIAIVLSGAFTAATLFSGHSYRRGVAALEAGTLGVAAERFHRATLFAWLPALRHNARVAAAATDDLIAATKLEERREYAAAAQQRLGLLATLANTELEPGARRLLLTTLGSDLSERVEQIADRARTTKVTGRDATEALAALVGVIEELKGVSELELGELRATELLAGLDAELEVAPLGRHLMTTAWTDVCEGTKPRAVGFLGSAPYGGALSGGDRLAPGAIPLGEASAKTPGTMKYAVCATKKDRSEQDRCRYSGDRVLVRYEVEWDVQVVDVSNLEVAARRSFALDAPTCPNIWNFGASDGPVAFAAEPFRMAQQVSAWLGEGGFGLR